VWRKTCRFKVLFIFYSLSLPSRDGAPRTPGFGKPPDSAPAELLIEKLTPPILTLRTYHGKAFFSKPPQMPDRSGFPPARE
ncbi:hypothetical protein D8L85_07020, partial [Neisseria gonorrhoeae]